ncbi:MAG TPA: carbonic anhydrase family protein [Candidatus Angelobacter sp.]|nr:carbonic anhydrase family protein [Candidatus Angelobacter sp.]
MSFNRVAGICLLAFSILCFPAFTHGQAAQLPPSHSEHAHATNMNLPSGVTDKCDPQFTYEDGPHGPSHWEGVCTTGQMQAPIDIKDPEIVPIPPLPPLQFSYQPADLDMVNDCNNYFVKLRFPTNRWLKYRRKPYRLSEIRFREPGETAVDGKRPPMALQFVHLSPETTILIIEVPVVVGKENPVIKKLWQHIPKGGKENKVADIKVNPMDLMPVDHGYYRFPGSLTTPICNEGVQWFLMKHPIEMSQAQINQYRKYYHDTARPLQPLNSRPLVESK